MDADLYQGELYKAHAIAKVLETMPLADMLNAIGRAHSIAPITDPTLYRDKMKALEQDEDLLRALHSAQAAIAKSKARAER